MVSGVHTYLGDVPSLLSYARVCMPIILFWISDECNTRRDYEFVPSRRSVYKVYNVQLASRIIPTHVSIAHNGGKIHPEDESYGHVSIAQSRKKERRVDDHTDGRASDTLRHTNCAACSPFLSDPSASKVPSKTTPLIKVGAGCNCHYDRRPTSEADSCSLLLLLILRYIPTRDSFQPSSTFIMSVVYLA